MQISRRQFLGTAAAASSTPLDFGTFCEAAETATSTLCASDTIPYMLETIYPLNGIQFVSRPLRMGNEDIHVDRYDLSTRHFGRMVLIQADCSAHKSGNLSLINTDHIDSDVITSGFNIMTEIFAKISSTLHSARTVFSNQNTQECEVARELRGILQQATKRTILGHANYMSTLILESGATELNQGERLQYAGCISLRRNEGFNAFSDLTTLKRAAAAPLVLDTSFRRYSDWIGVDKQRDAYWNDRTRAVATALEIPYKEGHRIRDYTRRMEFINQRIQSNPVLQSISNDHKLASLTVELNDLCEPPFCQLLFASPFHFSIHDPLWRLFENLDDVLEVFLDQHLFESKRRDFLKDPSADTYEQIAKDQFWHQLRHQALTNITRAIQKKTPHLLTELQPLISKATATIHAPAPDNIVKKYQAKREELAESERTKKADSTEKLSNELPPDNQLLSLRWPTDWRNQIIDNIAEVENC